jgi:hypothetical protein
MDGAKYRRSRICEPGEATRYMSITTVYMESQEEYTGQYHKHREWIIVQSCSIRRLTYFLAYGEINCVIPLKGNAEILGMQGFQGAGWTSPGPGT